MNIRYLIFEVLFVIIFNGMGMAQSSSNSFSERYDLCFTMDVDSSSFIEYPWGENAAYAYYTIPFYIKSYDRSLYARKYFKEFPFADRLKTEYEQRILLPLHGEKDGKISFESKGENIENLALIVSGLDYKERIVFIDTLVVVPDTALTSVSKRIPLSQIELLDVRIQAVGKVRADAYVAFSKLDVFIGGNSIDKYPFRKLLPVEQQSQCVAIDLDSNAGFDKVKLAEENRIIGLGESLHGNSCIKDFACEFIMYQVEKKNCKLVILEIPLENSLLYNRYIQDEGFDIKEELLEDFNMRTLLKRLKEYNTDKSSENKVVLLGMDYNRFFSSSQNSAIDIFDYVASIDAAHNSDIMNRMMLLLMKKDWGKVYSFMKENKSEIESILPFGEYECITHILNLSENLDPDEITRFIKRDSVMYVNAKFLIDNFSFKDAKVVVYGHSMHLNPVSTYPAIPCDPFGYYMEKEYMEDYAPVSIMVNQGDAIAFDSNLNKRIHRLSSPPVESLEYFLASLGEDMVYFPMSSEFDKLLLSRFKGSSHSKQEFFPVNLYRRYAGVFFINNVFLSKEKEQNNISFNESRTNFIDKNIKRRKLLEDIKERLK